MNFAVEHYHAAINIARQSVTGSLMEEVPFKTFLAILDKTAGPLVYIWEEWQLLTSEKRLPYATDEYRKQLEAQIQQVRETVQKAEQMGFTKKEA